jgi:hypothetical protein
LAEFENRVMNSVRASVASLKATNQRAMNPTGFEPESGPSDSRYTLLISEIHDIVRSELRVLAAEGRLAIEAGVIRPESDRSKSLVKVEDHAEPTRTLVTALVYSPCDEAMLAQSRPSPKSMRMPETEFSTSLEAEQTDAGSSEEDAVALVRTRELNRFKALAKRKGIRVTDQMLAHAADPNWNDRTIVGWWKRNDPRCTTKMDRKIRAVLARDPALLCTGNGALLPSDPAAN